MNRQDMLNIISDTLDTKLSEKEADTLLITIEEELNDNFGIYVEWGKDEAQ